MNILYAILALVLLVFIVFQGKAILPRVVSYVLSGKRNFYFEDSLSQPEDERRGEIIQPVIEKMEAIGFKSLGVMLEKQPLWARVTREIALASSEDKIFASIGFRHNEPSYFFYTPFTGGQIAITAYNAFRHFRRDDFTTIVVSSGEPSEMLEEHKKLVAEFIERGYTPYRNYDRASLIEATNLYYTSGYTRGQMRRAALISLMFWSICVLIFILFLRGALE